MEFGTIRSFMHPSGLLKRILADKGGLLYEELSTTSFIKALSFSDALSAFCCPSCSAPSVSGDRVVPDYLHGSSTASLWHFNSWISPHSGMPASWSPGCWAYCVAFFLQHLCSWPWLYVNGTEFPGWNDLFIPFNLQPLSLLQDCINEVLAIGSDQEAS